MGAILSIVTQCRNRTTTAVCLVVLATGAGAQLQSQSAGFDPGFKSRAMAHVRRLADCGIHEAGSEGDRKAARYVSDQMKKAGLSVTKERFTFHSFVLDNALLEAGSEQSDIVKIGL
jgi:hypothetical protein